MDLISLILIDDGAGLKGANGWNGKVDGMFAQSQFIIMVVNFPIIKLKKVPLKVVKL